MDAAGTDPDSVNVISSWAPHACACGLLMAGQKMGWSLRRRPDGTPAGTAAPLEDSGCHDRLLAIGRLEACFDGVSRPGAVLRRHGRFCRP